MVSTPISLYASDVMHTSVAAAEVLRSCCESMIKSYDVTVSRCHSNSCKKGLERWVTRQLHFCVKLEDLLIEQGKPNKFAKNPCPSSRVTHGSEFPFLNVLGFLQIFPCSFQCSAGRAYVTFFFLSPKS